MYYKKPNSGKLLLINQSEFVVDGEIVAKIAKWNRKKNIPIKMI